ncbi:MAG: peptidoglycan bridge formation glycyltransferase FemA/FemB family protein [Patescibacteria group bacterium]
MERQEWNQFVIKNGPKSGSFLQSWGWGEFQKSLGRAVNRKEGDGWVAAMRQSPIGLGLNYWYGARAPIGGIDLETLKKDFPRATFLRFDFPDSVPENLVPAPHDVQPRTTIIVDLKKFEEELLKEMHPKTRYNIRVAERSGVTVKLGGEELFEDFWKLLQHTTERNEFRPHPKEYYRKMIADHQDPELKIFLAAAMVDGVPVAMAIMCDFGGTRTYLHGALDYALRDRMAPFALHWELMKEAKELGITVYDFWGIAPTDDPKERLAGVTRFKRGWGGEVVRYPQTRDFILQPFAYRLYRLIHRLRR